MIALPTANAAGGGAGAPAGLEVAAAGLLLVAGSALLGWSWLISLAAVVPVALAILERPGWPVLAVDGLLILAYVVLADLPRGLPTRAAGRWLGRQWPAAAAGGGGTVIAAAALAVAPPTPAWLLLIGIAAVAAAVVIALPQAGRERSGE